MSKETHQYTNNEITIIWKPNVCIHSTLCWKGLTEVFNPKERPWIKMNGASTEKIIEQVRKCPSGALSYFYNEENPGETDKVAAE
ncbi:(4Fe-4S)-binding protein [Terrimonas pollutisoli]|uniref:(4Fe-4S)-binding protein n=1 Tax=Terrimonas pollutisoli TaxID=3034147 RepID=UPI0023EC77F4|nr:(4Fe-4S)-binding protein [Terrimonas sp. H1YJ31]